MKVSSSGLFFMPGSPYNERHNLTPFCSSGELKEIKQDISSLRFELLEREKHDLKALAELVRQLEEALHVRRKEEQELDMLS